MRIKNLVVKATILFGLVVAGLTVAPISGGAASTTVPCDGFALGYRYPSIKMTCSTDTVSQGRYSADRKKLYGNGSDYLVLVMYDVAAHNVYFPETSPQEGFEAVFGQLRVNDWGPTVPIAGFQTATFRLLGEPHPGAYCFAFDKYAGIPHGELEGPPGYTKKAYGFYCSESMADVDKRDNTIAAALQGLLVPPN